MVRDKYRLSDSISDAHVPSFSLDDAPPERLAHLEHLDPYERAEERRGDHGRDRDDDARMVEAVPGFRLSSVGPDDSRRTAEKAGRRAVRADREGQRRARVAVRDAGPEAANGRGHAERDDRLRIVPG